MTIFKYSFYLFSFLNTIFGKYFDRYILLAPNDVGCCNPDGIYSAYYINIINIIKEFINFVYFKYVIFLNCCVDTQTTVILYEYNYHIFDLVFYLVTILSFPHTRGVNDQSTGRTVMTFQTLNIEASLPIYYTYSYIIIITHILLYYTHSVND